MRLSLSVSISPSRLFALVVAEAAGTYSVLLFGCEDFQGERTGCHYPGCRFELGAGWFASAEGSQELLYLSAVAAYKCMGPTRL